MEIKLELEQEKWSDLEKKRQNVFVNVARFWQTLTLAKWLLNIVQIKRVNRAKNQRNNETLAKHNIQITKNRLQNIWITTVCS